MNVLHLLALPPEHPSTAAFWKETASSLDSGGIVSAYFLHEGASALLDPRLPSLVERGLRLFACPRAVEQFAPRHKLDIVLGGPGLLAELIERCSLARSFYSA
ncbi:MAG: hypothetical protein EBZ78_13565 [Verrucomicrobia bacterium]|nr:hypothetical protein [Verrucomicrobiota bacterium]